MKPSKWGTTHYLNLNVTNEAFQHTHGNGELSCLVSAKVIQGCTTRGSDRTWNLGWRARLRTVGLHPKSGMAGMLRGNEVRSLDCRW